MVGYSVNECLAMSTIVLISIMIISIIGGILLLLDKENIRNLVNKEVIEK